MNSKLCDNEIQQHASADAMLDGTGSLFQAFNARLIAIAKIITTDSTEISVNKFREWTGENSQKFVQMAGDISDNSDIFVQSLETITLGNLAQADDAYSTKIIQLTKDKATWENRFGPRLQAHLSEPPQKNRYWLGGLVFILVAIESLANSQFFAEGSSFGLLGGTLTAITISLGNVFIPLGLAFLGHLWFYRYDSYRALGVVMIVLFLIWALGFNHIVAQYRESLLTAASQDSSILNYVLLFTLGTTVAGFSFWKMWSFLDPYKQARKCLNDFKTAQEDFKKDVFADLTMAQNKYNDIGAEIGQMKAEISAGFQQDEANFSLVHNEVIDKINEVFSSYHLKYCVMKVNPDPELPVVTLENVSEYGGGITDANRRFFAEMKTLLDGQVDTAAQEWTPKLLDLLTKINALITRFQNVIIAKLLEWKTSAQQA